MKTARLALSALTLILLTGGYLGSQVAAFQGRATDWAVRMDQAPVRELSLVLLIAAVVLAFVKEPEDQHH